MESTEPQEPSYYEVALTNRQVLIAFVALLTCLLVAFLSGVWIGRGGAQAAQAVPPASPVRSAAGEAPLEQLTFFNGDKARPAPPAAGSAKPAPSQTQAAKPEPAPAGEPDSSDEMRQNLEATMAANRETPAMQLALGERTGEAEKPVSPAPKPAAQDAATAGNAATPEKAAAPATARPAAEAKPAATAKIFVQVYSSNNGTRAQEIVANLRRAGFPVLIAESPKGGGTNFRVRVGPFETRAQADAQAIRLRRDHRLDTWVTDSP